MQNLAPIALFVYNRPQHTLRTLKFLAKNELAEDSRLYIFSDGPKSAQDEAKVQEVRDIIKNVTGFKSIKILGREKNLGLANSIIEGVSQLTTDYGKVIVFEDDLISSPYTLRYFNDALNQYQDQVKVMHIGAYMYPINPKEQMPESFFFRAATSWGWATWESAWKNFEPNIDVLMSKFTPKMIQDFSIDGTMNFWKQMKEFKKGKNNSWAIRWYASIFLKNGLTLNPGKSLIQNIGHDGTGVHSGLNEIYNVVINPNPIRQFPQEIIEHQASYDLIKNFLKNRKGSLKDRLLRFLKEKWNSFAKILVLISLFSTLQAHAQPSPKPYGAIPSSAQLAWHEMELYGLVHFTPTTYENKEWGYGDANPQIFNPKEFDAEKIILAAKAGGLKAIILVAKHHDGFTLWPSQTTQYNISQSPFRGGQGDMVKEFELAARKHGLKFGVYCSPWDRNSPAYGGPDYLAIYQAQLKELYSHYGELFMSWHDGANGGDGYYGGAREKRTIDNTSYYDWKNTWGITRSLQPNAAIFSDVGPDVRWVGNEQGFAADTSWATFSPKPPAGKNLAVPGQSNYPESPYGTRNGEFCMPAECDVPLRKGWFYHPNEKPKSPVQLFDLYLKSVGRGTALDLGLAPDTRGLLAEEDVLSLQAFGKILQKSFSNNLAQKAQIKVSQERGKSYTIQNLTDHNVKTYWATKDQTTSAVIELNFKSPIQFDLINLQEYIPLGQRIEAYKIECYDNGNWMELKSGASIGAKRLIYLDQARLASAIKITLKAPVAITLAEIGVYKSSLN